MLKTFSIICAIGAMAFRPRGWRPQVIDGGRLEAFAIDAVTDLAPMASTKPVPPRVPLVTAVKAFMDDLKDVGAGNDFRLCHVSRSYEQLRAERGWPPASVKTLSQQLVKLGCTRTKLDLRAQGGGRPTALRVPRVA